MVQGRLLAELPEIEPVCAGQFRRFHQGEPVEFRQRAEGGEIDHVDAADVMFSSA